MTLKWMRRAVAVALVAILALSPVLAGTAQAAYGRTEGAAAGGMLGAVGGSALGSAIVAGVGVANPLLATGIMATSALGTGLLGVRVGSWAGDKVDSKFTAKQIWTVVGGLTGAMLGVCLGPAGSVVGKIVGGAVGAALGGFIANKLSDKANGDFNPRTVGALIGGINGALMGGPVGAAAGVTGGYVAGNLLDKYIMVKPGQGLFGTKKDGEDVVEAGAGTDADGDGIPDWYSGSYVSQFYDEDGKYVGGFDAEGYDRMGYDKKGFDRQGYDRFGYDEDGVDRQGYDQKGFKVKDPAPVVTTTTSTGDQTVVAKVSDNYDPKLYDQYWTAYSQVGGPYPQFDDKHWDYFPADQGKDMQQRYEVGQRFRMSKILRETADATEPELAELRTKYQDAVARFREAAKDAKLDLQTRRTMLREVCELERSLQKKIADMTK